MTLKAKLGLVFGSLLLIVACLYASATLQLRHESLVREQAEQQLLMSLSLMVEPFLIQNKVDQVKGHLLASSFSTTLPVKAILVYQTDGNLFAATQFPRELFNFSPTRDLTGRKALQDGSHLLWSAIMVTPASMSYFDAGQRAVEGSTMGYVAIQISPLRLSRVWLWQSCLWGAALLMIVSLVLFWQRRFYNAERIKWRGFIGQLRTLVAADPGLNSSVGHEGQERVQLFRLFSAQQQKLEQQKLGQEKSELQQGQSHDIAIQQLETTYKQQLDSLTTELSSSQRQLRQWKQLCVLSQNGQTGQQSEMLEWLLKQDQLDNTSLDAQLIWFPQWLSEQAEQWQAGFERGGVKFVLVEDCALSLCEVQFYAQHTAVLLQQIIALVLQDLQQSELSLHINLQAFADNKLLLQFDHAGHSQAIKQVLNETDSAAVLPQLCAALLARLGGKLSVSALEDLGCSVRLELPLVAASAREQMMYQTALLLDFNATRGAVLKQSVYSVAEQVICVQRPEQLLFELQHRLVDLVLIQLPDPEEHSLLKAELNTVALRSQLIAFCSAEHHSYWTATLNCAVLVNPMLSARIRQQLNQTQKKNPIRLLVVDDNKTNLTFVKTLLSRQDIEVDAASTGAEAIRLAKSCRYQMILMDIQLPDISGILATHMIRQLPQHQHTEIVAFTAHALPEEIEQFHQAGMNDVLIKPLDVAKAAALIRRCQQLSPQTPVPG